MEFQKGDRIELAAPYTVHGRVIPGSDDMSALPIGTQGAVAGTGDLLRVIWDPFTRTDTGEAFDANLSRVVDAACIAHVFDEDQIDEVMRSISQAFLERRSRE